MNSTPPTLLVGTVADPTKQNVLNLVVGRATVPAWCKSVSGCGLDRDHTSRPGLVQALVVAKGMPWA
jgi:hypothetical protein